MAEKLSGKSGSIALTQNTKNVTENAATGIIHRNMERLNR